jgi:hypothetical protein
MCVCMYMYVCVYIEIQAYRQYRHTDKKAAASLCRNTLIWCAHDACADTPFADAQWPDVPCIIPTRAYLSYIFLTYACIPDFFSIYIRLKSEPARNLWRIPSPRRNHPVCVFVRSDQNLTKFQYIYYVFRRSDSSHLLCLQSCVHQLTHQVLRRLLLLQMLRQRRLPFPQLQRSLAFCQVHVMNYTYALCVCIYIYIYIYYT